MGCLAEYGRSLSACDFVFTIQRTSYRGNSVQFFIIHLWKIVVLILVDCGARQI